ncbi:ComEC/Rec2 family competence protein [uncultured Hyphomonas sp.]|uniref:ComEC/Rec2 family competence protein n=1 Tax=uncultured Hyphomonas sp. TaxID=225298 RepID=UPI000C686800|nr:competence protein ComEC [Hyphomonadaceae bacterium]|tara:strand:+ start:427641 stop:429776 length:2136 start_codon:yes stop_codon:yes gene_type:complete
MVAGEALAPQKHNSPANGKGRASHDAVQPRQIWSIAAVDAQPLLLAFAMAGGAAAYFVAPSEPPFWLALLAPLAGAGGIALGRRMRLPSALQIAAWLAFGVALGMCAASVRARLVAAPVIADETGPVMVEGWLSEVETGSKGPRLRIEIHAIAGLTPDATPKLVRLTHRSRLEVSSGRFVRCWAVLRPPPSPSMAGEYDFRRQAWFEQLGGVGYVQGRCRGGALGAPEGVVADVRMKVAAFRRRLAAHVNVAAGERAGGFAAALVSGDRSYMRVEDQVALRNSGLAHLLAISGLHMAIVGGLVFYLMRRLLACLEPLALRVPVQKPAAVIALGASLAYLVISGAGVSTQRAFIMLAVVFGAVLFDRAALSLRSFAIAMILVILLQPESVMTPGFQMSFAASGALIATYEAWTARRSASDRVMGGVSYSWASLAVTSLVAGTATAPYALYHFDRLAGLGLLANLAAMPVITFVTAPAAAAALILTPFGYGDLGLRVFGYSLEAILWIAETCTEQAPSALSPGKQMPGGSLVLFSTALGLAVIARGLWRWAMALALSGPAIWLWIAAPAMALHWSASGDVFVRLAGGEVQKFSYVEGDGLSPMRFSTLDPSGRCSDWPCILESEIGRIALRHPDLEPGACSLASDVAYELIPLGAPRPDRRSASCAQPIYWSDVLRQGGVTLHTDGATSKKAAPCEARPWKPCEVEPISRNGG